MSDNWGHLRALAESDDDAADAAAAYLHAIEEVENEQNLKGGISWDE